MALGNSQKPHEIPGGRRQARGPAPHYRLAMVTQYTGYGKVSSGWRASLPNGWTHCQHFHATGEAAIDCLEAAISEVMKP